VGKKKISKTASGVIILGEGRDEWDHRFFKFAVHRSASDIPPFSAQQIMDSPTTVFGELADAGANTFQKSARNELIRQLDERKSGAPKFKVVTRLGWNSGAFVLPGKIIGQPSKTLEPSFRHLDQPLLAKYRVKGTLKEWQTKIGRLCPGNSRLMFCASLGLTGPILPLVGGPRSGGFQLFGDPESGKTAAAMVTGSIWGCHRAPERRENGFAENWHTTAGKVEITALAHNETVLILDETKRAGASDKERAQVVVRVSFGLAEGTERARLINVQPVRGWRFYVLSTSNYSLDELAQRGGIEIDDAERGRFVDIPIPSEGHGIYENLQFPSGQKFTDRLKNRCKTFCGAVGQEFVRRLVQDRARDPAALKRVLKRQRAAYLRAIKAKAQAEGLKPLNRASGRFATVFAAGSLAIKYKIFRWDRDELLQAILACQLDGLRAAKAEHLAADTSDAGLRRKLVTYFQDQHRQFMDLDQRKPRLSKHELGSVPGYVATFKGEKWFYLSDNQLRRIIGTGNDAVELKKELVDEGLMAPGPDGRYVVQRPIFSGAKGNKGWPQVHAFRARLSSRLRIDRRVDLAR
jgi:putative DNA primase/helicase